MRALARNRTVRSVVEGLKKIREKNEEIETVVLGICPRPRESVAYDVARAEANSMIRQEVLKLAQEGQKVRYLGVDYLLRHDNMFKGDGVHLNQDGLYNLGRIMLSLVSRSNRGGGNQGNQPQGGPNPSVTGPRR